MRLVIQVFQLANGDQVAMTGNVKLVFETDDLSSVTPSLITRTVGLMNMILSNSVLCFIIFLFNISNQLSVLDFVLSVSQLTTEDSYGMKPC